MNDKDQRKKELNLIQYLKIALTDFGHVATLFPSSPWASRSVLKHLKPEAKRVVEYGPGDGILTKKILQKLSADARVFAIEVNEDFVPRLNQIGDKRLEVVAGDVVAHSQRLRELSSEGIDAVISGIPFSFLSPEKRDLIAKSTSSALRLGGRFIVYQNSPKMTKVLKAHFKKVSCYFEPRNIFPYFIMVAEN